jgi:type IV pilus assembly protein PilF
VTQKFFLFAIALLTGLLSGCASGPNPAASGGVEQAVSRQATTNDERQRAKVHTELGRMYLMEGRYEVALDEARIALESERNYAPAHNLAALVYMALQKNELAGQSFRQAIGLAANDPEINNDYGWFLCQTGKAKDSIQHFQVAIANPLFHAPVKALTNAGLCALIARDDRQAEGYLLRAFRLDRGNLTALFWLADIDYRSNRLREAQQKMKDLHAAFDPTPQSAWLALRIERKLGDREGEARFTGILRRKYRDTPEYEMMVRGEFE